MTFLSKVSLLLLNTASVYVLAGDILQTSVDVANGELKAQAAALFAQISFRGEFLETALSWSLSALHTLT